MPTKIMPTNLVTTEQELHALIDAIETAVDIANDTVTEALFIDMDTITISNQDRQEVDDRIDRLVALVRIQERLRHIEFVS